MYSMEYWGTGSVNEKLITRNAKTLFQYVGKHHVKAPHVFGHSLGCAVAVAAIYAGKYEVRSLSLFNPFTSCEGMVVWGGLISSMYLGLPLMLSSYIVQKIPGTTKLVEMVISFSRMIHL